MRKDNKGQSDFLICLCGGSMRWIMPENEKVIFDKFYPYMRYDKSSGCTLTDDAPEEARTAFSEYMVLIQNKKADKETYNAICKKLDATSIEELCKELHDYYEIRKNDTASLDYYPLQCLTPEERNFLLEYVDKHGLDY